MKNFSFKLLFAAALFAAISFMPSCKSKTSATANDSATSKMPDTTVMTDQPTAPAAAPVTISPDDSLTNNLKDATKDFPGVTATVNNGEVTLAGNITRDKLPALMKSVNSLHPKKINNNLTIK